MGLEYAKLETILLCVVLNVRGDDSRGEVVGELPLQSCVMILNKQGGFSHGSKSTKGLLEGLLLCGGRYDIPLG